MGSRVVRAAYWTLFWANVGCFIGEGIFWVVLGGWEHFVIGTLNGAVAAWMYWFPYMLGSERMPHET